MLLNSPASPNLCGSESTYEGLKHDCNIGALSLVFTVRSHL